MGTWAFCISAVIGVSLGILSAIKQYSFLDTTVTIFAVTFASVPSFFVAVLMILFFAVYKGWLPSFGIEGFTSYIMPVATLVLANIPILSRMTRSSMLDAMTQDYIRTARAKGCSERRVIWKHALKNACLPIITLLITAWPRRWRLRHRRADLHHPGGGHVHAHGRKREERAGGHDVRLPAVADLHGRHGAPGHRYALIDPKIGARYKK